MTYQLTIGKKLVIGVAALVACLAMLSFTTLRVISALGGSLDAAVNKTGKELDLVGGTREAFQQLRSRSLRAQIAFAIAEMEKRSGSSVQGSCTACHTPASVEDSLREMESVGSLITLRTSELRSLVSDPAGRGAVDTLDRNASQWVDYSKEYLRLAGTRFEDAHAILRDKIFPIFEESEKAAGLPAQRERDTLSASDQHAHGEISASRWAVFTVVVINLIVAGTVLWVVFCITSTLRQVAIAIGKRADEVAAAASLVSSSSHFLAQGSSEQAATLEQTSASSEEINAMAHKNSENSRGAADLVMQSQGKFVVTNRALEQTVVAMGEINTQSSKISQIMKVIDEIAFQTNITALTN